MKNEMTAKPERGLAKISEQVIKDWLVASKTEVTNDEFKLALGVCQINHLNPFKKEVHIIKYGNKLQLVTGYDVYLKRADACPQYDGYEEEYSGNIEDGDLAVTIKVHRKDLAHPIVHTVFWSEVKQPTPIWGTRPKFMTHKTGLCQTFRIAFPNEMGSLPYSEDEITLAHKTASEGSAEIIKGETPLDIEPKKESPEEKEEMAESGEPKFGEPAPLPLHIDTPAEIKTKKNKIEIVISLLAEKFGKGKKFEDIKLEWVKNQFGVKSWTQAEVAKLPLAQIDAGIQQLLLLPDVK